MKKLILCIALLPLIAHAKSPEPGTYTGTDSTWTMSTKPYGQLWWTTDRHTQLDLTIESSKKCNKKDGCTGLGDSTPVVQIGPLVFALMSEGQTIFSDKGTSALSPSDVNLSLGINNNGKSLIAQVKYTNSLYRQLLSTQNSELNAMYEVNFLKCNDLDIRGKADPSRLSVDQLIASLQAIRYTQFFRCEFEMTNGFIDGLVVSSLGRNAFVDPVRGMVFPDGRITLEFGFRQTLWVWEPPTNNEDYNKPVYGQQVLLKRYGSNGLNEQGEHSREAAKAFIKMVKQYANVVIDSADLSKNEKEAIIKAAIQNDKPQIVELLRKINENFNGLDMIGKIEVVQSINEAYDYVKEIETRVGNLQDRSQKLNLGMLIQVE